MADLASILTAADSSENGDLLVSQAARLSAEQRVEATKFDLRAAKAAFFPSLTLGIGIGYQAFNPAYLFRSPESLVGSVLAGIVAPMFNWSALRAQCSAAKATQIQAMYSYQKTIVSAFIEVTNGLSELQKTESILGFKKKRQAAMAQTVEMADTLFRAGRATYLEVLVVQQTSLQTDLELIEAWKRQHLVQVAVYKALGGGWR
jgi:outer membrane protein TolC